MLLLNEKNTLPRGAIIPDVTVLRCHALGVEFTARRDGCSFNYATDRDGNIYSDAGVLAGIKADITARRPVALYVSGREITGWKSSQRVGNLQHASVSWHNWATQLSHIVVRMFDGSLWYGKYSHLRGQLVTLRPYKGQ